MSSVLSVVDSWFFEGWYPERERVSVSVGVATGRSACLSEFGTLHEAVTAMAEPTRTSVEPTRRLLSEAPWLRGSVLVQFRNTGRFRPARRTRGRQRGDEVSFRAPARTVWSSGPMGETARLPHTPSVC